MRNMLMDHTPKMFLLSAIGVLTSAIAKNIITSYYLLGSFRIHSICAVNAHRHSLFLNLSMLSEFTPNREVNSDTV